ncbi:P13-like protein [Adoxophyes honmai nucleopolyhedrovirus]|uniref:p13-like protein n=1 Tax=Adoxophyes honmai nucleopolyhedrovirus TaxID=224399 RepID=Q80LK9_NPVAH|nr:P13-like protein [Adoxophyes honmai nucleopolyhedrovirus]BAC67338.1 P13-like protein [Adoxophyes honmai nucleopolyhedrovirus]
MFAYVTFVMLGDNYVQGAVALAKSLKLTRTKHDLICMITDDVSENAVTTLSKYFTKVIEVEYIHYKCPKMLTMRQNNLYGDWIDFAFTKWNCLKLTKYRKIVYLDADHLVVKNIDHLFYLNAPALCFTDETYGYYDKIAFGETITANAIKKFMLHNKVLCKGGTVLFEPDTLLFETIRSLINSYNKCLSRNQYHNGFDEQILLQAFVKKNISVTQLSVLYAWNAGTYHRLSKNHEPFVINYYGDIKPWNLSDNISYKYMDIFIWKYINDCNVSNGVK